MGERLGRPKEGDEPRFLTQVEAEVCGISRTWQIFSAGDTNGIVFQGPIRARRYTMEHKIRAIKKLEDYWVSSRRWREETEEWR